MTETSLASHNAAEPSAAEADSRQILRTFIVDNYLFGDERQLADDTSLIDSGVFDSTGVLELVAFLEERFDITLEDRELVPANLDSIAAISRLLQNKGAAC